MSNTDNIKKQINKIYQTDVQAIRNLAEVAIKLQKEGLTIPGNLTVKGNFVAEKDSTTKGNHVTNGSSTTKKNQVINGNSTINGSLTIKGNQRIRGDLIFNGGNNWILHTPDDGRHILYIAPSHGKGTERWNWGRQTRYFP